ncbi:bifunctional UDP-N-acetylglucosamine diphosphorylase/glucosamine-1-phosphate N-acetyltransferase GlmU [Dichelobacter nodosus]|uniref:Bifunctional protein GlmU n=1 Tax=Dichelobacter nodosus (strain VCS1703A) TaxID=246195 RepID=GLMU_DICNV|nr:bifunctional UDP-N-acetylglucosamine diphosphorylase/glucosamine-1-phosphate N-acetyltransferase GlmU [Dichelobacter nodosus]A5EXL2.1 RecName: Full=Bifunctional protein GlmU; Includes: RecName: Full=UDP-N-acetylglucosamine pyrophosphorylase; AltName: Full=N-acetylglucosamine-1-phosphate uridyltransferase; Includes: RecName: Full=Glucosamine-1-phosphate N-acetyltransferase [Dichelobacter nodosus VCS1703A]ABQ13856.1 UDP-N-acetylglucosamine pyrophosphorylase [Dichelobacter nodosus VCS1703A]AXM45
MLHKSVLGLVLAAGMGTRMRSNQSKALQMIGGKPMIAHLLASMQETNLLTHQAIVYGYRGEALQAALKADFPNVFWVKQEQQLGTGDAVKSATALIEQHDLTLIAFADIPLIRPHTLQQLLHSAAQHGFAILTAQMENPFGYGRIIHDETGGVCAIVEEKDANREQKNIREINVGVMAVKQEWLLTYLPRLENHNAQGEFYLSDLVELIARDGHFIESFCLESADEAMGANDRAQLAALEAVYRQRKVQELFAQGVTLIDPNRIDIHGTVIAGADVVIEPNVFLKGTVVIGDGVTIESGCCLKDCEIGRNTIIRSHSVIDTATIGAQADIGPFARIRPQTVIADGGKIGNFVEIKAAKIGQESKVNHLSYIGDAHIGAKVNVGAGTITCNYDGAAKHPTFIGDHVFIGSNTALVAPVTIKNGATIGAGSVITRDVAADTLALTRPKLTQIEHWRRPQKKKEHKNDA